MRLDRLFNFMVFDDHRDMAGLLDNSIATSHCTSLHPFQTRTLVNGDGCDFQHLGRQSVVILGICHYRRDQNLDSKRLGALASVIPEKANLCASQFFLGANFSPR